VNFILIARPYTVSMGHKLIDSQGGNIPIQDRSIPIQVEIPTE
jgi:hypothetical protein